VTGFWRSRDAGARGHEDAEQFNSRQDGKGRMSLYCYSDVLYTVPVSPIIILFFLFCIVLYHILTEQFSANTAIF